MNEQLEILRRIGERALKHAQETAPGMVDVCQHMLDEVSRTAAPTFCCGNDDKCAGGCECQCHALKAEVDRLETLRNAAVADVGRLQQKLRSL